MPYPGRKIASEIANYVIKQSLELHTEIECENLDAKLRENTLNAVFFGEKDDGALYSAFNQVAHALTAYHFYVVDLNCKKMDAKNGAISVYRKYEEYEGFEYKGGYSVTEVTEWLKNHEHPTVFNVEKQVLDTIIHE